MKPRLLTGMAALLLFSALLIASSAGSWLMHVPEAERQKQNPFAAAPEAVAAGARLFHRNCAECHGDNAQGRDKHPSLHTDEVRNATPGELQWLLRNGSMKNGMPSWSKLPEQQRWQIVSYLKSLR